MCECSIDLTEQLYADVTPVAKTTVLYWRVSPSCILTVHFYF